MPNTTDSISLFLAQTGGTPPTSDQVLSAPSTATGTSAPAPGAPAAPPAGGSGGLNIISMLPLILIFLAVMIVPQMLAGRKEKKKRAEMMSALGKGDKVLTIGGQIGVVDQVRDNEVVLRIDENSNAKARFTKPSIQQILESASKGAGGSSDGDGAPSGAIEVKTKGEKVLAAR